MPFEAGKYDFDNAPSRKSQDLVAQQNLSLLNPDSVTINKEKNNKITTYQYMLNGEQSVTLDLFCYKGYSIEVNGKKINYTAGQNGCIEIIPPSDSGTVIVYYEGTALQKVSLIVSLISLLIYSTFVIYKNILTSIKK